jgi:hypothetical protein
VGGGLDERPAQIPGPEFGERAAQVALARLVDARAEAGVAGERAGSGEAADVTDLGGDRVGEHPTDPGHREQERHVAMVDAEPTQLTLAVADLAVELVDQTQAGLDRALPGLGQSEPSELLAAAHTEQIGDRTGLAVREQDSVHTLLQAGAVTHQV